MFLVISQEQITPIRMKSILKQLLPPILVSNLNKVRVAIEDRNKKPINHVEQRLDVHWKPDYAKVLETWGLDNVWNEIQMFLVNCEGSWTKETKKEFTRVDVLPSKWNHDRSNGWLIISQK